VTDVVAPPVVRPAARPSPTRLWGFDPWLMIMVGIMIVFGLVMVYSASWDVSYRLFGTPNALTVRQLGNLVFGLIALAVAAVFPIRYLRRLERVAARPHFAFTLRVGWAAWKKAPGARMASSPPQRSTS